LAYLVDNDGEWGELRFDFENGDTVCAGPTGSETAEICGRAVLERQGIIIRRA